MKYAGTVCGIVVFVLCFALMAYAEPTAPAPEDKTEAAMIQAIAEAEAKLQPLEDNVNILWKEMFEDRQVKWEEMRSLNAAIEKYEQELETANQHLSIYGAKLTNRLYLSTLEFNKFYFKGTKYGYLYQLKMRLIAAKEGVDLRKIETHLSGTGWTVPFGFMFLGWSLILYGWTKKETSPKIFGVICMVLAISLLLLGLSL